MNLKLEILRGGAIFAVFLIVGFLVLRRWLRRTQDDPVWLIVKWVITAGMAGILAYCGVLMRSDSTMKVIVPWVCAFLGIGFAVLWTRNIVNVVLRPLWHAIDGADEETEPRPLYSIARAKRARGKYLEALADARAQLTRFPTDVEGQLLVAEILADNLNDLPGAEIAIGRLVAQPNHAPRNIGYALNTLADWHLKYAQDREGAQHALERIQELCPGTEMAAAAAQRIAHLGNTDLLLAPHDRLRFALPKGEEHLGLLRNTDHLRAGETDPAQQAAAYAAQLQIHPLDTEAREKLAVLYADHFHRLDLAADQLDQLIEQPNQPVKLVAHWVNLLADLQVRHGANYEAAWQTLQRLPDRYPDHPVAELARNRMDTLKLEFKGKEKSQAVQLGSYEQNIGLTRGLPRQL